MIVRSPVQGGHGAFDELVSRWSGGGSRPTAVIAGNSLIGIGVLGAAHRHGLSLPDDFSIATVHDTTIARPAETTAIAAAGHPGGEPTT